METFREWLITNYGIEKWEEIKDLLWIDPSISGLIMIGDTDVGIEWLEIQKAWVNKEKAL